MIRTAVGSLIMAALLVGLFVFTAKPVAAAIWASSITFTAALVEALWLITGGS
jgi:hypothetical protein